MLDRSVTRRRLLAVGVGLVASRSRADEPPAKISQAKAQYQNTPKDLRSCAICTFFVRPRSCKIVAGDISSAGWCKLFDMPD